MSFAQVLLIVATGLFLLAFCFVVDILDGGNETAVALLGAAAFSGSFLVSDRKYGKSFGRG